MTYNNSKLYEGNRVMKNYDIAKEIINDKGGIATTVDFLSSGLKNYEISNICKDGLISRIRQGCYCLPDKMPSEEHLLSKLLPESIVCLESALYHYGYNDYAPTSWSVAVPRTISLSKLKIEGLPLVPHFIPASNYELGKMQSNFNGYILNVYDRERTICDCFKYRNQLDSETFAKAINAYSADDKKNLTNLSKYSKQLRVYKKVTEMMEVLLNG